MLRSEIDQARLDRARTLWEAGVLTLNAIAAETGLSPEAQRLVAQQHKWGGPRGGDSRQFDRSILLERLFFLLETQIKDMEALMKSANGAPETAALQRLVATMDKLLALERSQGGAKAPARQSAELAELRQRVMRRLKDLELK